MYSLMCHCFAMMRKIHSCSDAEIWYCDTCLRVTITTDKELPEYEFQKTHPRKSDPAEPEGCECQGTKMVEFTLYQDDELFALNPCDVSSVVGHEVLTKASKKDVTEITMKTGKTFNVLATYCNVMIKLTR